MTDIEPLYHRLISAANGNIPNLHTARSLMNEALTAVGKYSEEVARLRAEIASTIGSDVESSIRRRNKELLAEVNRLRDDCGEAYQAVGIMASMLGWWKITAEHPWHRPIEKLLDNLSAAAGAEDRPHDDLLPFVLEALEMVQ